MFEKGHVVLVLHNQVDIDYPIKGSYGVIVSEQDAYRHRYSADLFPFHGTSKSGHNCGGILKRRSGWNIDVENLRDISEGE